MKRLTILGSTGSIGTNCLNVVETHPDDFAVAYLATHSNIPLLYQQAARFQPAAVVVVEPPPERDWAQRFNKLGVEYQTGAAALAEVAAAPEIDVVVNAIVGAAGLPATLKALRQGHFGNAWPVNPKRGLRH
jgi:1-deoxy-D-xylulose-5-phosphate reductoisomerase